MKIAKLFVGFLFLFGCFAPSVMAKVYVCKEDNRTQCTTLRNDIDDTDDIGFKDNISYIEVQPYTSAIFYKDNNFNEDNIKYSVASSANTTILTKDTLSSLGLHDEISSIKVHSREIVECKDSIDSCLMTLSKPILIYDEGTADCNAFPKLSNGTPVIHTSLVTTEYGGRTYKKVSHWFPYGYKVDTDDKTLVDDLNVDGDCGVKNFPWWFQGFDWFLEMFGVDLNELEVFQGHTVEGEHVEYVFLKVNGLDTEDRGSYWALVADNYVYHGKPDYKSGADMLESLRVYVSESKHASFHSSWECESLEVCDLAPLPCSEPPSWEFEDCDAWLGPGTEQGDNGGEVRNPNEYGQIGLVDCSCETEGQTSDCQKICGQFCEGGCRAAEAESWFRDITVNPDGTGSTIMVPSTLVLEDITITGSESKNYEAESGIEASRFIIEPNGSAQFKAGNEIHLQDGFHAKSGSAFQAKIGE